MSKTKLWWKSRIIWVNSLAGVLAGAVAIWPLLQEHMNIFIWAGLSTALAGLNVALRFVTTDEVIVKKIRKKE